MLLHQVIEFAGDQPVGRAAAELGTILVAFFADHVLDVELRNGRAQCFGNSQSVCKGRVRHQHAEFLTTPAASDVRRAQHVHTAPRDTGIQGGFLGKHQGERTITTADIDDDIVRARRDLFDKAFAPAAVAGEQPDRNIQ